MEEPIQTKKVKCAPSLKPFSSNDLLHNDLALHKEAGVAGLQGYQGVHTSDKWQLLKMEKKYLSKSYQKVASNKN